MAAHAPTSPTSTADDAPAWLPLFISRAAPAEVVDAWLKAQGTDGYRKAAADPPAARTALRLAIVNARASCSSIDDDATSGWKYTGSLIRAVDRAFDVTPHWASPYFGKSKCPEGSCGMWWDRRELASPQVSTEPLASDLLEGWRRELRQAADPAVRSHKWAAPHWIPIEEVQDETLLDRTIRHVLRLSHAVDAGIAEQVGGAEFWTQRVSVHKPCKLHWDCDEMLGQTDGVLECPLMSAILYIGDEGGPTLMVGRSPTDELEGHAAWLERAWLTWPHAGQLVAFPGDMLHGVLPLPRPEAGSSSAHLSSSGGALRQTVLINLWPRSPQELPTMRTAFAPRLHQQQQPPQPSAATNPDAAAASPPAAAEVEAVAATTLPPPDDAEPAAPGVLREAPAPGTARAKHWLPYDSEDWPASELDLGMFYGWSKLWVQLPPMRYRTKQLEEFEAKVWC